MFEKCDSSNRHKWMVASFNISARLTGKFELFFDLAKEKPNRKGIGSSKNL